MCPDRLNPMKTSRFHRTEATGIPYERTLHPVPHAGLLLVNMGDFLTGIVL
jgi:hypothetical protein